LSEGRSPERFCWAAARRRGYTATPDRIGFSPVDRDRARVTIRAGMVAGTLALGVFALAFLITILYMR
jgi:hypothetical protein